MRRVVSRARRGRSKGAGHDQAQFLKRVDDVICIFLRRAFMPVAFFSLLRTLPPELYTGWNAALCRSIYVTKSVLPTSLPIPQSLDDPCDPTASPCFHDAFAHRAVHSPTPSSSYATATVGLGDGHSAAPRASRRARPVTSTLEVAPSLRETT